MKNFDELFLNCWLIAFCSVVLESAFPGQAVKMGVTVTCLSLLTSFFSSINLLRVAEPSGMQAEL